MSNTSNEVVGKKARVARVFELSGCYSNPEAQAEKHLRETGDAIGTTTHLEFSFTRRSYANDFMDSLPFWAEVSEDFRDFDSYIVRLNVDYE